MDTKNEWLILTNAAKRRRERGVKAIEDETLLDIDGALNFLLAHVIVDEKGVVRLGSSNTTKTLANAITYGSKLV